MAVHDLDHPGPEPLMDGPQTWRDESMCRKHPTRWWFAGGHSDTALAKSICGECAVREPCLEFALSRPDLLGIWAATTPADRSVLRRQRRELAEPSAPDTEQAGTAIPPEPVSVESVSAEPVSVRTDAELVSVRADADPVSVQPVSVQPVSVQPVVLDLVAESEPDAVRQPEAEPLRGPRRGSRRGRRELLGGEHADLLTPAEAARKLGVTPNTVTRWSRAGKIAAIQTMGGHRRFRRTEIERLLHEAGVAATNQY